MNQKNDGQYSFSVEENSGSAREILTAQRKQRFLWPLL